MGHSRKIWIEGPAGRLEAAVRIARPERGAAVVAHPHPLHGGTLHNPVVFHTDRELNRAGFTTLRFNFRGVGESDGSHDDGRGEVEDLAAAVDWVRGLAGEVPLLLVGYSFGGLCSFGHAVRDPGVAAVVAIGLPVRLYGVEDALRLGRPIAVVQGSRDELGSPEEVRDRLKEASPPAEIHVVGDAGHRFSGKAAQAAAAVLRAASPIRSG